MKIMRKLITPILIASLLLFFNANSVHAQTGLLPSAGIVSFKYECDCPYGIWWIWFTPLYLGGPVVFSGPMDYSTFSTTLYAYPWDIGVPGKWHLDDYIPGVQACWVQAGFFCFPLIAVGLLNKVGMN